MMMMKMMMMMATVGIWRVISRTLTHTAPLPTHHKTTMAADFSLVSEAVNLFCHAYVNHRFGHSSSVSSTTDSSRSGGRFVS
jgi:hypothetical protein